jgi:TetR/AcrR family transcriptional regulator, transcriptional repressor for nem operon
MEAELSPRATEIIARAQALLAVGGYNGFSYADISESVRISKASVHHHFPSKAELVQTVVKRYREEARNGLAAIKAHIGDPLAQLQAYTGYWKGCIRDGSSSLCVCAMLAAELPAIPEQVAEEVRGHFRDLAAWLASVLEKGAATKIFRLRADPEAEAQALMATIHGAMLSARAYGDPEVFARIVEASVAQLTRPA